MRCSQMKVMLTGPPHSGKSTSLKHISSILHTDAPFKNRISYVIEESAIQLISLLQERCSNFAAWRRTYNPAWQSLVAGMQIAAEAQYRTLPGDYMHYSQREDQAAPPDVYIDSSPLDCLAFVRAYDGTPDQFLLDACQQNRYDLVFYHALVEPFDARKATGRLQSKKDCLRIGQEQLRAYTEHGMTPIILPLMPVEDRLKIIKDRVSQKLQAPS